MHVRYWHEWYPQTPVSAWIGVLADSRRKPESLPSFGSPGHLGCPLIAWYPTHLWSLYWAFPTVLYVVTCLRRAESIYLWDLHGFSMNVTISAQVSLPNEVTLMDTNKPGRAPWELAQFSIHSGTIPLGILYFPAAHWVYSFLQLVIYNVQNRMRLNSGAPVPRRN